MKDDPGELPPVVDYEQTRTDNNPATALGFLKDFLDTMISRTELYEDAVIKRPMIYSGPGFWALYGDQTKPEYWIQFPLWNAHWTTSPNPMIPPPWTMWNFWQFSAKGPGEAYGSESLAIDMNRFNGTLNELMEFTGIRIPADGLSELYQTLDDRVNNLAEVVTGMNQPDDSTNSEIAAQVDTLTTHVSNLDGTLNNMNSTLTHRIAAVEQKVATLGGTTTPPTVPTVPVITPTPSNGTYATCTTSALNVRSGPGVSYPIVGGIHYGMRVKVLNRQNSWSQLEDPAGWCSEAYLTFEQSLPTVPVVTPAPIPTNNSYGICNTSGLNVRNGPGVTYSIVGGLTYGQRVKILDHKNGWAQIETPAGWCNESYLSY
ncbi:MAG: SH3 domain-containing protein [Anaerolineales bacterium]|nr:SH3 domain-containing protein [Anaerolineales bacterium]